jgi:hypothetical protein
VQLTVRRESAHILEGVGAIYLNTDLILRSRVDIEPLHRELVDAGLDHIFSRHWHGVWEKTYESEKHHHPSEAIDHMLDVVGQLSPIGLNLWSTCMSRRFNVGFQGSDDPYPWTDLRWSHTTWQFTACLLERIASANASFVVTFYPKPEVGAEDPSEADE